MAVALGTNSGFVTSRPSAAPGSNYGNTNGYANVTKHTTPSDINKITEMGWYCNTNSGGTSYTIGLYADSAGVAGALLYSTTTSLSGTGWKYVAVDWDVSPSTDYWLGLYTNGTSVKVDGDYTSHGGAGADARSGMSGLPNPFSGGALAGADYMICIYGLVSYVTPPVYTTTECGSNATSTTIGITLPAYSTGDLVIINLDYWGPSAGGAQNITWPSGPNSETITSICTNYGGDNTSTDTALLAIGYYIATDSYAGGTWNVTASVGTRWEAAIIRVDDGAFDTVAPLSTATSQDFSTADEANATIPAFNATSYDADGMLFNVIGVDQDPVTGVPSGYTALQNVDMGRAVLCLAKRDSDVTTSESISSAAYTNTADSWAGYAYIVRASGSTPSGPTISLNIGDTWKASAALYINIGDTWKTVSAMKINIGDTWKDVT